MKASENFKIQGYLQLFMAFWPKGHPDVKFYMAMNFDTKNFSRGIRQALRGTESWH